MKLIKKTKSICPKCLKVIDAAVFEKKDGVWMYKECDEHGKFKGFIEKDADFYKKTMNITGEKAPIQAVVMPITHRCNLNCKFCFVPNRKIKDKPLNELKKDIRKIVALTNTGGIALSGGEPTLRKDLFELIEFIKTNYPSKFINILTNGLKLEDLDYVRGLKKAGLDNINFSLNGFDEKVYQKTNNAKLLDIKMNALKNLKKEKMVTFLSPTLIRGLNEKDLKHIINFALDNLDFVAEVRIRGAARIGRHDELNPLTTSEMLELVANALGKDKRYFLKNFSGESCYHSSYQFHIWLFVDQKRGQKRIIDWDYGEYGKFTVKNKIKYIGKLIKILSRRKITEIIKAMFQSKILLMMFSIPNNPLKNPKLSWSEYKSFLNKLNIGILRIKIWYWADRNNIDLNEIRARGMLHTTADGRILPYGEAMIRADEL